MTALLRRLAALLLGRPLVERRTAQGERCTICDRTAWDVLTLRHDGGTVEAATCPDHEPSVTRILRHRITERSHRG